MAKAELVEQTIGLIERYTKCLSNDAHLANKSETFENLSKQVAYYVKAKETHEKTEEVFNTFVHNLEDLTDSKGEEMVKDYKKQLAEELKKLGDVKNNKRYKEFLKLIQDPDSDTSEIQTVSESLNLIDPISKKPIADPVKNKKCGHSYERSTIVELISKNPNLRCPMVGCSISGIKKTDLIDDPELKRLIEKNQQQQLSQPANKSISSRICLDDTADNSSEEIL